MEFTRPREEFVQGRVFFAEDSRYYKSGHDFANKFHSGELQATNRFVAGLHRRHKSTLIRDTLSLGRTTLGSLTLSSSSRAKKHNRYRPQPAVVNYRFASSCARRTRSISNCPATKNSGHELRNRTRVSRLTPPRQTTPCSRQNGSWPNSLINAKRLDHHPQTMWRKLQRVRL